MSDSDSTPKLRKCTVCGEAKPHTKEFFPSRGGEGLRATCRVCFNLKKRKKPKRFDLSAGTRTCSACGKTLLAAYDNFAPVTRSPDGFSSQCRECLAAKSRERHRQHPEKHREEVRLYSANNRERVSAYQKQWRKNNPDRCREHAVQWAKKNPWQAKAISCNKRARLAGCEGEVSGTELEAIFESQEGCCFYCGKNMSGIDIQIDHKIALSNNGPNTADNICFSCAFCNNSKRTLTPEQFAQRKSG